MAFYYPRVLIILDATNGIKINAVRIGTGGTYSETLFPGGAQIDKRNNVIYAY